jgi:hypothetical protein
MFHHGIMPVTVSRAWKWAGPVEFRGHSHVERRTLSVSRADASLLSLAVWGCSQSKADQQHQMPPAEVAVA